MFAFIVNVIIILIVMKIFFKFMYPKPPKEFFAKKGDDISMRICNHCGHSLATYRGILEQNGGQDDGERFFCNDEHREAYLEQLRRLPNQNG
ncbi:hypothetical protein LU276_07120 [Moraxella haemolytica]|uniref:hypothetical protein n=1 Tax=Moraxella TaxID=475 RepID=UPI00254299C4|nr:hypothetical protein [Moraxella sp. ZY171148]WII94789.1 hypothetical protein LU276_07120 [Moraxella sp. ZY171148]